MDTLPSNRIFKKIREERQARQKTGSHVLQRTIVTGADEKKWTGYLRRHGCMEIQGDLVSLTLKACALKDRFNSLTSPPDGFASDKGGEGMMESRA